MVSIEKVTYLPVGQLYMINGHNIHAYTSGSGEPSVVFITGSGTPCAYTDYYFLQEALQNYARTLSYDHAGFGWSDKTDQSREVDVLVEELHQLLSETIKDPPYIIVAHSLGSLEALRYAQLYKEDVQGIILLDGGSPEYYSEGIESQSIVLNRLSAGLRISGLNRLASALHIVPPVLGQKLRDSMLPADVSTLDTAMFLRYLGNNENLQVIQQINENARKVIEGGYLDDIPLLILSSDSGPEWLKVQKQLVKWSNDNEIIKVNNAQHYIHWPHKETVILQIAKFIEEQNTKE